MLNYLQSIFGGLSKITPTVLLIAVAVFIVSGIVFFFGRKLSFSTKALVYGALAAALSFVLSYLRIYRWPQGGSITPASMLPLFVYSYIFGPGAGVGAGLAYGLLHLVQGPYILHPVQVFLDYILAYAVLGLAGLAPRNLVVGSIIGGFARFFCSFLSGVVFFGSYAPEGMNPIVYSLYVNLMIIGTDTLICIIVSRLPRIRSLIEQLKVMAKTSI